MSFSSSSNSFNPFYAMRILPFQYQLSPEVLPLRLGEHGFTQVLEAHVCQALKASKLIRYAVVAMEPSSWHIEGAYQEG
ncbi:MAG: hypothetical protein ACKO37_08570 [Vampirovibrionales bacterium]